MNAMTKLAAPKSRATDADKIIGRRTRDRRIMLGLTQQQMADRLGVTYQQAHKYERGINRVSASRLQEIATVLNVPVSFFFDASRDPDTSQLGRSTLELVRCFNSMTQHQREAFLRLGAVMTSGVGV